jgi:hypothetical protein
MSRDNDRIFSKWCRNTISLFVKIGLKLLLVVIDLLLQMYMQ